MVFDVTSTTVIALSVPKKVSKSDGTVLAPTATSINPCDGPELGEMLVISGFAKNSKITHPSRSVGQFEELSVVVKDEMGKEVLHK